MTLVRMLHAVNKALPNLLNHPFNLGLLHGTLSQDRFLYFLEQDKLYLQKFSGSLLVSSHRAPNERLARILKVLSNNILHTEINLHKYYLKSNNTPSFFSFKSSAVMNDACKQYTEHLKHMTYAGLWEVGIAAQLPCYLLYRQLAVCMKEKVLQHENPYRLWINSYSSQNFMKDVTIMIQTCEAIDTYASDIVRDEMLVAFTKSLEYEKLLYDEVMSHQQHLDFIIDNPSIGTISI